MTLPIVSYTLKQNSFINVEEKIIPPRFFTDFILKNKILSGDLSTKSIQKKQKRGEVTSATGAEHTCWVFFFVKSF